MLKIDIMSKMDSADKVKKIISEKLGLEENTLQENLSFKNDLGADSLDICEVVWEVEKKFKFSISDEETENIRTIGDLIVYVKEKQVA
jgi:acyl carrier protein